MYSNVLFTSAHLTCINTATDFDEVFVIRCAENRHFLYFQYPTFSVIKTNYWMIKKNCTLSKQIIGWDPLTGPPSHWSPNATLVIQFSLVPHLICPPMRPWFHSSQWSPISLVLECDPDYTVLIGSPSHWSPQWNPGNPVLTGSPVSEVAWVPHCNPFYSVLIVPPSHWSPNATLSTLFSLFPHLTGLPMQPFLFHSHYYTLINTGLAVPMIHSPYC